MCTSPTKIRQINLISNLNNPIKKVVWSSFDYTSGPVLNLALEYFFDAPTCDQSFSSASSNSPFDTTSVQEHYEDIDDVFNSQLITVTSPEFFPHVDTGDSSFTVVSDNDSKSTEVNQEMEESGVDSGIATNHSMHSEISQVLSNSGHQFPEELTPSFSEMHAELSKICDDFEADPYRMTSPPRAISTDSTRGLNYPLLPMDSQNELLTSMSGEIGIPPMAEEEYVTKHALAEQITGNFISCNPIIHKLTVIPARRLAFGSHIFWLNPGSHDLTMMAFSIIFNDSDEMWYTEHRDFFDIFMEDLITDFKLKYDTDVNIDELNKYLETEFSKMISMIANMKKLKVNSKEFTHDDNLLLKPLSKEYSCFLQRAISGVIMSRGHTYIYDGADYIEIKRLFFTLSLFLEEKQRNLLTNPYATHINPYLCLQIVNEKETAEMKQAIIRCRWPVCIVDVRRKKVFFTGPYWEHQKKIENFSHKHVKPTLSDLKLMTITYLPVQYSTLLSCIPNQTSALQDILSHFRLIMKNEAKVFVELVKVLSEPRKDDKINPYSSKFKLSEINRILRITSHEELGIVLANAESLLSDIAEFIYQNAQFSG